MQKTKGNISTKINFQSTVQFFFDKHHTTKQHTTKQTKLNTNTRTKKKKFKRFMNGKKTTLPSQRNIEWRTVKTETKKINQVLTYISTNNITELNELMYARAKLVCEKIGVPFKTTKKKSKPG